MTVRGNRVYCTVDDVRDFQRSWPCSEMPEANVWFEFASNGDLVDIGSRSRAMRDYDGEDLVALSNDAQQMLNRKRGRK